MSDEEHDYLEISELFDLAEYLKEHSIFMRFQKDGISLTRPEGIKAESFAVLFKNSRDIENFVLGLKFGADEALNRDKKNLVKLLDKGGD